MLGIGARLKQREQSRSTNISTETGTQNLTESCLRYENPRERLASYEDHRVAVSKERASEAGLYHTGNEDILQCFSCGLKLRNWQAHDDPMKEHASHSKDCQFVIQKKGEDYVNSVCRRVETISYHRLMEEYNLMKLERDELMDQTKALYEQCEQDKELAFKNSRLREQISHAKERINNLEKECQQYKQLEVENGILREQNEQVMERLRSLEKEALPKAVESHDQLDHQEGEAAEGGEKEDVKDKNLSAAEESCIQNGYSEEDVMKAAKKLKEGGCDSFSARELCEKIMEMQENGEIEQD